MSVTFLKPTPEAADMSAPEQLHEEEADVAGDRRHAA